MAKQHQTAPNEDISRPALSGGAPVLVLAITTAVFIAAALAAFRYAGLIHILGEWQFRRFGAYSPMASVLALAAIAAALLSIVRTALRRKRKNVPDLPHVRKRIIALRNCLYVAAFIGGIVALISAINLTMLPDDRGQRRTVNPLDLGGGYEGRARLHNFAISGPMARYSDGTLFWKKEVYLVPLKARGASTGSPVIVLAQVTTKEATTYVPDDMSGILRRNAVPLELLPLYAARGIRISDKAYILFRDTASMSFPSIVLMIEATLFALFAALAAIMLHRHENAKTSSGET